MLEYDLVRLGEHQSLFWDFVPFAIATFGGDSIGQFIVSVQWQRSSDADPVRERVRLAWDTEVLKAELPQMDRYLETIAARDEDQATRIMKAAVIVAVAVMSVFEPSTKVTRRSNTGTRHDYYLNETRDEMLEVKGLWEGGLPGLFVDAKVQSDLNLELRRRWVSVTVFSKQPRNRTEGLHS